MKEKTFEALKAAYLELLAEPPERWRINNQELYVCMRNAIADELKMPRVVVQDSMEWYSQLRKS